MVVVGAGELFRGLVVKKKAAARATTATAIPINTGLKFRLGVSKTTARFCAMRWFRFCFDFAIEHISFKCGLRLTATRSTMATGLASVRGSAPPCTATMSPPLITISVTSAWAICSLPLKAGIRQATRVSLMN